MNRSAEQASTLTLVLWRLEGGLALEEREGLWLEGLAARGIACDLSERRRSPRPPAAEVPLPTSAVPPGTAR